MKRTLQELLDYAEEMMDRSGTATAGQEMSWVTFWQGQSQAASLLAQAVALAAVVKFDRETKAD